jgi:MFS family permease
MNMSYQAGANHESSTVRAAKSIVALSGLALVITVPFAMVSALPEMARQFRETGNGLFVAQMVLALPVLAMLIGAPLGGWVADVIGIRRCLLTALFAYVASGAICLVAPNLPILVVARLLLGFFGAAAATMCTALTAEWYQGDERNRILGYAHAVVLVYNIVMLVSGGWLVDHIDWRAPSVFYFVGALTLAATYIATRGQNATLLVRRSHASVDCQKAQLWPLYLLSFLLAFGAATLALQGPFLLSGAGVTSSAGRGLILVVTIVTGALASSTYATLRKHLRHSTLILISGLTMGLGITLSGIRSGDIGLIVVGYIVCGIGYGLYIPVISAIVLIATPPVMRNRAVGLMNGSIMLATIANPLVISLLRRSFELPKALVVVGIVLIFVGPIFVLLFRPDKPAADERAYS